MIDDVMDIAGYYTENVEAEHARLEEHQLEHDPTWRYLERYLPPRGTLLEISAEPSIVGASSHLLYIGRKT